MKKIILITGIILIPLILNAQTSTGSIKGRITDSENGEPLISVNIIITGTTKGTITDVDGNYVIASLTPGKYNLSVSYITYEKEIINDIIVTKGESTIVNVQMTETIVGLEEVIISGRKGRKTENALLMEQKESLNMLNSISAQEISLLGDNTAASSLERVSGISVMEGKYVYVRGLSDRYSKTGLNGANIPNLDPSKNTVQLDMFPSNIIDNITVYKTFSPDLPGDFTGGYVNIITKDFPDEFTFHFSNSLSYNPQSSFNDNFLTYKGGKYDWLGFDDGTRSIPDIANQEYYPSRYADDENLAVISKSFNKIMEPYRDKSLLGNKHDISAGDQISLFNKELGFVASFSYERNYKYYEDGINGHYRLTSANSEILQKDLFLNDEKGEISVLWGALINLSYKLNNNNRISLNIIRNQSSISIARYQYGWDLYDESDYQTRTLQFFERSFTSAQLRGKHNLNFPGNLRTEWMSSYSTTVYDEPDIRFFTNLYEDNPVSDETVYTIDIAKQDPPTRYFRDMSESDFDNKIEFILPKKSEKLSYDLKLGASFRYLERDFNETIYEYLENSNSYKGSITDYISDANMISKDNSDATGVYIDRGNQASNNYDGIQYLFGAYLMSEIKFSRFKLLTGTRMEDVYVWVKSKNPANPVGKLNNIDFLPAFILTYSFNKKNNVRTAYTKTLARPAFRELAPYASFEFMGDYVFIGNADLKSTRVDNIDLRWEFYPEDGELISAGYFFKYFTNPIERTFNPNASNQELTLENASDARVHGVEIEIRKSLDFISFLKYYKAGGNITFVNSTVSILDEELDVIRATDPSHGRTRQMYGQAPYIINAYLTYQNSNMGIKSGLAYNISGEKLSIVVKGGTPNIFEQPRGELDFTFDKTISDKISVKFGAKNLLNTPYRKTYSYKGTEYIYSEYKLGRSYSFGINYNIN